MPGAAHAGRGGEPLWAAHAAGEPGAGIRAGARLLGAALAGSSTVASAGSASAADPPIARNADIAPVEARRRNAALARHAAASGTVELVTLQQGRPERSCTETLRIR